MVNNLGALRVDQGEMVEAEAIYLQALQGYENAVGADRPRTRAFHAMGARAPWHASILSFSQHVTGPRVAKL
jgi:hypothetical protein